MEPLSLSEHWALIQVLALESVRYATHLHSTPQSPLHHVTSAPPTTKVPPIEEMPQWMRDLCRSPWSPILTPTLLYAIFMHGIRDGLLVIFIWYLVVFTTIAHFNLYHNIVQALSDNLPMYCPETREASQAYFNKGQKDMYVWAVYQADKTMFFTLCLMLQGEFLWPISFRKCLYGSATLNVVSELVTSGLLIRRHLHFNLAFWRDYWITVKKQEEAVKANGLTASSSNQPKPRISQEGKQRVKPIHELPAHLGFAQHPYFGGSPAHKPPLQEQPAKHEPKPKRSARKKVRPEACARGGKTEVGWDFLRQ